MKDIMTGVLCIAFSLFFGGLATKFPHSPKIYNSPAVYPQTLVILLSILAVMLIFVILGDEYPRVTHEFSALLESALIFLALTAISALMAAMPGVPVPVLLI